MKKQTVKIVGPCSKWIQGVGWVTEIPIVTLNAIGFVEIDKVMDLLKEKDDKNKQMKKD